MELHIKIIGVILVMLALIHIAFPRYFNWKAAFASVTLLNRQMMYVHTFFIALVVLLMGMLCITSAVALTTTALGREVSLGLGIFWAARLFTQFFWYSSSLWRGKVFETTVHVVFSLLWVYFSGVFLWVYLR
jgi:hypothetical protein